ncbi:MAG: OmpH family outer membrane protein [Acidobacteriales bacterium]|nr:OmpH family outer membrane protein [Terriglobales bacterium]
MKRKLLILTASALTMLSAASAQTAAPATAAPQTAAVAATGVNKVALINFQQAIFATNEGRRDLDALNKKFDPKQTELKSSNDEIERLKKELSANTDKLSEEERAKRVQAIEAKQKALQRNAEDAQNEYAQQGNEIASRIGQKLFDVMQKYATQNGIGLVMDVSQQNSPVLFGSDQSNITAAVVEAYNAQSGVAAPPPGAGTPRPPAGARPTAPRPTTTPKPAGTTTPK